MPATSSGREYDFFRLYDRFVRDSARGRRLQPNGKRIGPGTIANYGYTRALLSNFAVARQFSLRIISLRHTSRNGAVAESRYWKRFYQQFTDYLYKDCGHFDNYVGQNIKNIRVFFNYLNKDLGLGVGDFYKKFYVRKEEIAIYPLLPEELNYLIYDQAFRLTLAPRMQEVKDFFVFGCTVALRVSDLFGLRKSNLRSTNGQYYLQVRSKKTGVDTAVKLPAYAVAILLRYQKRTRLLPHFNIMNLNKYIKQLLELAGFIAPVEKRRERRGQLTITGPNMQKGGLRFCDVASTHTMRRTAITTMLSLGMPEQVVRKISGHAPGSKEFYRYVSWAQSYQDMETEKVFEKLREEKMKLIR